MLNSMLMSTSWLPVLAEIPTDPAARAGYMVGIVICLALFFGLAVFGIISIIMAFTKRTTGWIVMGSISGAAILLVCGVLVVTFVTGFTKGFMTGFNKARLSAAQKRQVETITGKVVPFTIEKPAGWTVKRDQGAYDAVLTNGSGYVGIIAEKADLGSNEPLANFARKRFQNIGTDLTLGNNETVTFDGRTWIGFTARCKVENLPFAYHCYVHSGKEGSTQLMAWSFQNQWDSVAGELDRIMRTVHLPNDAPASAKAPAPAKPSL
jgi:hypothetical protein